MAAGCSIAVWMHSIRCPRESRGSRGAAGGDATSRPLSAVTSPRRRQYCERSSGTTTVNAPSKRCCRSSPSQARTRRRRSGISRPIVRRRAAAISCGFWRHACCAPGSIPPHPRAMRAGMGVGPAGAELIRMALVLCADHEPNASSFTGRCFASTNASLRAVVVGGLPACRASGMAPPPRAAKHCGTNWVIRMSSKNGRASRPG